MGSFSGGSTGVTINSSEPVSPNSGELWIDNSSDSVYVRNSSNDGWITITPIGNTVESYDTTIGNYTTPTTMSASSLGEISETLTTNQDGLTYNQVSYGSGYSFYSFKAYSGDLRSDGKNVLVHEIRVTYGTAYSRLESATLKFFNEAGSLVHTMSWGEHINSWTAVTSSNVDLNMCRWEMITSRNMSGGATSFTNFKFDVYLATPASVLNNGNTADRCKTQAEANPSFTADLGSSLVCTHYAIYMEADTDETGFDLEYSTDDITYTKIRTLPKTKLINGQWNYVRFNPVTARYIKIKGNSGSAKTLSATQIKIKTNANFPTTHGHNTISATDNTLTLSG